MPLTISQPKLGITLGARHRSNAKNKEKKTPKHYWLVLKRVSTYCMTDIYACLFDRSTIFQHAGWQQAWSTSQLAK